VIRPTQFIIVWTCYMKLLVTDCCIRSGGLPRHAISILVTFTSEAHQTINSKCMTFVYPVKRWKYSLGNFVYSKTTSPCVYNYFFFKMWCWYFEIPVRMTTGHTLGGEIGRRKIGFSSFAILITCRKHRTDRPAVDCTPCKGKCKVIPLQARCGPECG